MGPCRTTKQVDSRFQPGHGCCTFFNVTELAHHGQTARSRSAGPTVLFLCPTFRDQRELALLNLEPPPHFLFHSYASEALENLTAASPLSAKPIAEPLSELQRMLQRCAGEPIDAVCSTDDYPGSTMASITAAKLDLPGLDPRANLLCQHKFLSRQAQQAAAPEAVPRFQLLAPHPDEPAPSGWDFPFFVKPIKSFFSAGAQVVRSQAQLRLAKERWANADSFFQPFDALLGRYTGRSIDHSVLLAEGLLHGLQSTLD